MTRPAGGRPGSTPRGSSRRYTRPPTSRKYWVRCGDEGRCWLELMAMRVPGIGGGSEGVRRKRGSGKGGTLRAFLQCRRDDSCVSGALEGTPDAPSN